MQFLNSYLENSDAIKLRVFFMSHISMFVLVFCILNLIGPKDQNHTARLQRGSTACKMVHVLKKLLNPTNGYIQ